jgi:uncharacterized protein YndB with AHSA1/START domain
LRGDPTVPESTATRELVVTRVYEAPAEQVWQAWTDPEFKARRMVEELALALQASLLVRHAPAAVADAFCAGRLGDG